MDVNTYVGLRWKKGGRSTAGFDCWGLVRHVLAQEADLHLPRLDHLFYEPTRDTRELLRGIAQYTKTMEGWSPVSVAHKQRFDVIHLRSGGPIHFGIMVDERRFLHIERGCDSIVESVGSMQWARKIKALYRHEKYT